MALSRDNALFAGSDEGGASWAAIVSLVETCKLNGVEPQRYVTDTLTRLPGAGLAPGPHRRAHALELHYRGQPLSISTPRSGPRCNAYAGSGCGPTEPSSSFVPAFGPHADAASRTR